MDTVEVLTATPDDADRIAPVHRLCWHEAYTGLVPQRCLDDLDKQDRVAVWRRRLEQAEDSTHVAVQGGRVLGLATVGLEPARHESERQELRSLYVVREAWGRGNGRLLLGSALDDRPAALWVFEGNQRARQFYAATGWHETSDRHVDDWTAIPELRLIRDAANRNKG